MYHNEAVLWRKSRGVMVGLVLRATRRRQDSEDGKRLRRNRCGCPQRAALIQYEVQNFSGSFDGTVRCVRASSITHSYDKKILKHTNALKYDESSDTNARTQTQVRARILLHVG